MIERLSCRRFEAHSRQFDCALAAISEGSSSATITQITPTTTSNSTSVNAALARIPEEQVAEAGGSIERGPFEERRSAVKWILDRLNYTLALLPATRYRFRISKASTSSWVHDRGCRYPTG
jgi:hypothetical protein